MASMELELPRKIIGGFLILLAIATGIALLRKLFHRPMPDERRAWLEGILWPRVGARVAEFRAGVEDAPAAVVEVPLLFESGMESVFDKTIAVVADERVRAERAGARGHELLEARTARQLTQDEKAQRADFVVRNDGDLRQLETRLSEVLAKLGD